MRRFLLIVLLVLIAVVALTAGTAAWLLHDESFLKGRLAALAQVHTGRALHIEGPLSVDLGRVTIVEARGLRLANAEWAQAPDLASAGHLRVGIDLPSLFSGPPLLTELVLEDCAFDLERDAAGQGSWVLRPEAEAAEAPPAERSGPLPVMIGQLDIARCRLGLRAPDGALTLDLRLERAALGQAPGDRIDADVRGLFNGQPLTVDGWMAPAGAFARGGSLRHELRIRAGPVQLDSTGTIADIRRLAGLDLNTRFSGPEISALLRDLQLPPVSEGPFDFRVELDTQGELTVIDLDGDLGSLELYASGSLDRFVDPTRGRIELRVAGPDLHALGEALDVANLVPEPFTASATAAIEDGTLRITQAQLDTDGDRVEIGGTVALHAGRAGSELDLHLDSRELARWAVLLRREPGTAGAVELDGHLTVDEARRLSIEAQLQQGDARLHLAGPLGVPGEALDARLAVTFSAPRPGPLMHWLAGRELPAMPLEASGTVRLRPGRLGLDNVRAASGPHELRADGDIGLAADLAGSTLEFVFDSPDLADFGPFLGRADLPAEPLRVEGALRPDGRGLALSVREASLGAIRVGLEGRIADRGRPREFDADFELGLPGPGPIHAWWPWLNLPEGPLNARGSLRNGPDRLQLSDTVITLGDIVVRGTGEATPQGAYDFRLTGSGPDAAPLSAAARLELPPQPFRVSTRLSGDAQHLDVGAIDLVLGDSRVTGEVTWTRGPNPGLVGRLHAPLLDLTPWVTEGDDTPDAAAAQMGRRVFDDTPVLQLADLGLQIDGHLAIDELRLVNARASDVKVGVSLAGRRLAIEPFELRGAGGGSLAGRAVLDGSTGVPELALDLRGTDQRLSIGSYEGQDPATLPRGDVTLILQGRGNTRHELAASLDGRLRMSFGAGEVAPSSFDFLLTDFLTELIDTLNPFTERSKVTRLDCMVAGADVTSGQVVVEPVVIHAEKLTVVSQGKIDLGTEKISFSFDSKQRKGLGISASDLVDPFVRVGGTLAEPAMALDPAGTVVKGGLAVATAGLSILARSLADRYLGSKDPCGDALRALDKRDSATP
jgi:uncharacterized protein involved in outer membrane biogenesis